MSGTLRVLWTVSTSSTTPPRPILRCSRCDAARPFDSSGKFRLNANGKRLDAWLVYRCVTCGLSWNRPVFERRRRDEIPAAVLDALQCNDAAHADAVARDAAGLARWAQRIESQSDDTLAIHRALRDGDPQTATEIRITVAWQLPVARGDRLLALGLGVSRNRIEALVAAGCVEISGASAKALARPLADGAIVTVLLSGIEDARRLALVAAGRCAQP